ncbi:MAG TPA: N-acetyltransferase [Saprospiraceae bacterium]|nr:N-acetyltransferase [Saprospiraceae bacterium]
MFTIRQEQISDAGQIRLVNTRAFGQVAEADIVDALRKTCPDGKSFVAESEGEVVGHILFTPVVIESNAKEIWGMGLAPMSVLPEFQRQGIGSRLIQAGLDEMRKTRQPFVIVLGHPEYYPRFGFKRASDYGIASQYDNVPEEAFMILILNEGALKDVSGIAKYRAEFDAAV